MSPPRWLFLLVAFFCFGALINRNLDNERNDVTRLYVIICAFLLIFIFLLDYSGKNKRRPGESGPYSWLYSAEELEFEREQMIHHVARDRILASLGISSSSSNDDSKKISSIEKTILKETTPEGGAIRRLIARTEGFENAKAWLKKLKHPSLKVYPMEPCPCNVSKLAFKDCCSVLRDALLAASL